MNNSILYKSIGEYVKAYRAYEPNGYTTKVLWSWLLGLTPITLYRLEYISSHSFVVVNAVMANASRVGGPIACRALRARALAYARSKAPIDLCETLACIDFALQAISVSPSDPRSSLPNDALIAPKPKREPLRLPPRGCTR